MTDYVFSWLTSQFCDAVFMFVFACKLHMLHVIKLEKKSARN
jgi:hypothetical protein